MFCRILQTHHLAQLYGKTVYISINNRLQSFTEKYEKISECQAGFRKSFSTTDHIFALHTLINFLQCLRKSCFVAF